MKAGLGLVVDYKLGRFQAATIYASDIQTQLSKVEAFFKEGVPWAEICLRSF